MSEENKVELDKETLKKLFSLAGMEVPENIESQDIENITGKLQQDIAGLKADLSQAQSAQSAMPAMPAMSASNFSPESMVNEYLKGGEEQSRPRTVLIIDDLGVIVYQLELLFKKMGFEVTTSNRVKDCITKFKKKDFGYVIMDLFLPTEKEGFLLLDELKKLVLLCKLDTKIVVMTASSKTDYKINCKNRGADYFIEKTHGWQNELINYCK